MPRLRVAGAVMLVPQGQHRHRDLDAERSPPPAAGVLRAGRGIEPGDGAPVHREPRRRSTSDGEPGGRGRQLEPLGSSTSDAGPPTVT